MNVSVGIHDIAFSSGHYALDSATLAAHHGVNAAKYIVGLGQTAQTVPAADEDIVTMAACAARRIIDRHGTGGIRTVLLATETGIDQAKSAGIYVHHLIGLPPATRVVELKQACYSGTCALQMAAAMVARDPTERVLVIATDVARYDLDSKGEPTQGAGAVAMLIAAEPAVAVVEPVSGVYTADIADFWRPNHRTTAIADGKLSIAAYLHAVEQAWKDYETRGGHELSAFAAFCYHQPFTRMAYKAHARLLEMNGVAATDERLHRDLHATTIYNAAIGNSYTASLYIALLSLLDHADDLAGKPIGLFSYGSGCVAEFFSVTVVPGYRRHLRTEVNRSVITNRVGISYEKYLALRREPDPDRDRDIRVEGRGPFRLSAVRGCRRIYEASG
ncbi:hydroxymethylglutaryl-CoA synthase [Nocardia transvalensis]|uniref:hydroxymethylglutaryl-CoA synthase n=1 Tax=Nocardia transvalensis TaxID=37333 RepID=UPI001894D2C3|nr:hydroxymethylglutaryl-CoA synthase [Nocardia transvalensis]MBF6331956.1 hydroxymethylglutaryl-CoA synthase [Nocardia transvalensis]